MDTPRFTGFPPATFAFLRALARHNDREWFTAHKREYDDDCVAPSLAFVAAVGPRLASLSPGIQFAPQLGGSLLRIHRDLRFVRGTKPYKEYLDLWFWRGDDKGRDAASFSVRLHGDRVVIGAGIRVLAGDQLTAYRDAVADPKRGKKLATVLGELCDGGRYALAGKSLSRVPSGFDAEHPRAELLRRTGLFVCRDTPVPKSAASAKFAAECVEHFARMVPITRWLQSIAA
jgi:uncharacterized protein (TIGR02453 family)